MTQYPTKKSWAVKAASIVLSILLVAGTFPSGVWAEDSSPPPPESSEEQPIELPQQSPIPTVQPENTPTPEEGIQPSTPGEIPPLDSEEVPSTEPEVLPLEENQMAAQVPVVPDATTQYTIYPIPYQISYGEQAISLPKEIVVTFGETVDSATKFHLKEVLQQLPEYTLQTPDLFEKNDGYLLLAKENGIFLVGKDNDALFCAIATLQLALEQSPSQLRFCTIEDYADVKYRGVVEGYYGIPWSNENIISYMEWGSKYKMNTFIYAPKDDPYHNSKWREPYPDAQLQTMKELIEAGVRTKVRFIYAIHPFMSNGIDKENFDQELKYITDKFQVMYDLGVRQFALLADDAVSETALQVKTINALTDWLNSKPDTYPLVFCPQAYSGTPTDQQFNPFWDGTSITIGGVSQPVPAIAPDVEIMHTGGAIIGNVEDTVAQTFQSVSGRYPYFWLNWPVNDYTDSTLFLGKAEMLKGTQPYLNGLVSNPMCEAQLSKIGLFQVADYSWNIGDFQADSSWKASFAAVDPAAAVPLAELAKHMSYPRDGVYHTTGLAWEESEELAPLIEALKQQVNAGQDASKEIDALKGKLQEILDASNQLMALSQNAALKEEYAPYKTSLDATLQACLAGLSSIEYLANGDYDQAWGQYSKISSYIETSNSVTKPGLKPGGYTDLEVKPGTKRLRPLALWLQEQAGEQINEVMGFGSKVSPYFSFSSLEASKSQAQDYLDGDDTTFMSLEGAGKEQKKDDYFGVDLGKTEFVQSVRILQGSNESDKNIFHFAILEISTDGENWTTVKDFSSGGGAPHLIESDVQADARYIRLRLTQQGFDGKPDYWLHVREFDVQRENGATLFTNLPEADSLQLEKSQNQLILTANKTALQAGQYIGVDFGKVQSISLAEWSTKLPQGAQLQYSASGQSWLPVADSFVEQSSILARYVRIKNTNTENVNVSGNLKAQWQSIQTPDVQCSQNFLLGTANNATTVDNPSQLLFQMDGLTEGTHTLVLATHPHNQSQKISLDKLVVDGKDVNLTLSDTEGLVLKADSAAHSWMTYSPKAGWLNNDEIYLTDSTGTLTYTFTGTNIALYGAKGPDMADFAVYVDGGYACENSKNALFDSNDQTLAKFHGDFVTVDLGQLVDVEKLRLKVGENLYTEQPSLVPGSGKIQLSVDGQQWNDIHSFRIVDNSVGGEGFTLHQAPFYYLDIALDSPQKAQFVRIQLDEVTDFAFNEMVVNDGNLMQQMDWASSSSAAQSPENPLAYMTDSDLSTGFQVVSTQESTIEMQLTNAQNISALTIIQDSSSISHAVVQLFAKGEWIDIEHLDNSINQIDTTPYSQLEKVRLVIPAGANCKILEIVAKENPSPVPVTVHPVSFLVDNQVIFEMLVPEGDTTYLPNAPQKDGFEFVGWFAQEKEFTSETAVGEALRVGATYTEKIVPTQSPSPTPSPSPTVVPTPTPIPVLPTATPSPTAAPTPTATPSLQPIPAPTAAPPAPVTPPPQALGGNSTTKPTKKPSVSSETTENSEVKTEATPTPKPTATTAPEPTTSLTTKPESTSQSTVDSSQNGISSLGIVAICVVVIAGAVGIFAFVKTKGKQ